VPLIEVDQADRIDITVDGADEVDGRFRLIKGGGGCLLREKIIAHASDLMVVVVDETKLVETWAPSPCRWRWIRSASPSPPRKSMTR
jgi:ribose 5-phosphate isomerase A